MRRRTLCVVLVLVLTLAAPACGGGPEAPIPGDSVAWSDCGGGLWCATLPVPVDHGDPDGPSIDLALAVDPAPDRTPRIGTLLVNPGGPGVSGIDALRSGPPLPRAVLERFDVVTWDPRGVGASTPVDCGPALSSFLALDPRSASADRTDLDRLAPAVARSCADRSGPLIDHLTTGDHAEDMEAVRIAVGEGSISYLGLSYGTRLGLEYLARHGDRVDAMILDGVVPPDISLAELLGTQAAELELGVDRLVEGGTATVAAVREDAAVGRLTGLDGDLDPVRVDRAVVIAGYDPDLARRTRSGLIDAMGGDGRTLDEQGLGYEQSVDLAAYLATTCADGGGPRGEQGWDRLEREVEATAPTVGAVVVNELRPCAFWPGRSRGPAPAPPTADGADDAIVVLVVGTGDPATPPQWARTVADDLPAATLVEIDGPGHIALDDSRCARDLAGRVLTTGAVPADPTCP